MHSHQRRASKSQQSLRFRVQKTTVWWRQEGNNSRFGHKTSTWWIRQVPISGPGSQERGPNVDSRALENTLRQRSSVEKRIIIVQIKDFELFSAAVNKPGAETLPFLGPQCWTTGAVLRFIVLCLSTCCARCFSSVSHFTAPFGTSFFPTRSDNSIDFYFCRGFLTVF